MKRDDQQAFAHALSIPLYVESLGFKAYPWQRRLLESWHKRKLVNGARQGGKSTIISAKPCHKGRFTPGSLSIIAAATLRQAKQDRRKVADFIGHDRHYPKLVRNSDEEIELANGSRIIVVPATETSARGDSSPDLIILDEAARIDDVVYQSGIRPMLVDNPKCELVVISTPNGRQGFFWRAWKSSRWERYEIRAPWDVDDLAWKVLPPQLTRLQYQQAMAKLGIRAWYSPRHWDREALQDDLDEMGPRLFRQEMFVEFVEREFQVFSYAQIDRMFDRGGDDFDDGTLGERPDVPPLELT